MFLQVLKITVDVCIDGEKPPQAMTGDDPDSPPICSLAGRHVVSISEAFPQGSTGGEKESDAATAARRHLIETHNWTIPDGGPVQ